MKLHRIAQLTAGFLGLVTLTGLARADGLIYQLPSNGLAARYDVETARMADGEVRTSKGSLTISSVGETEVDGEKCRWIELRVAGMRDNVERVTIVKCLIPEKHLGRGKTPGDHVLRGWIKSGDGEPQPFTDIKMAQGAGRMINYLAGPPANSTELDAVDVETATLGKLSCKGVTGTHEFDRGNGTTSINFENRLHEKSPFGVVKAVWKIERRVNGQAMGSFTSTMTLADINPTALSELSGNN
jgi:hypothetical protein